MRQGLVSIIIPTHNRADVITKTLESIEQQTYSPIEVIVVNDHSSDDTESVVNQYAASHSNIRYITLPPPMHGACAARNYGFKASGGAYIQWFDDDDLMPSTAMEEKVRAIEEKHADFCCSDILIHDESTGMETVLQVSSFPHDAASMIYQDGLNTQNFMLTREAVQRLGTWNERIERSQDAAYFHRLFLYQLKGVWLPRALTIWNWHEGSISISSLEIKALTAFEAIQREWHGRDFEVDNALFKKKLVYAARYYLPHHKIPYYLTVLREFLRRPLRFLRFAYRRKMKNDY